MSSDQTQPRVEFCARECLHCELPQTPFERPKDSSDPWRCCKCRSPERDTDAGAPPPEPNLAVAAVLELEDAREEAVAGSNGHDRRLEREAELAAAGFEPVDKRVYTVGDAIGLQRIETADTLPPDNGHEQHAQQTPAPPADQREAERLALGKALGVDQWTFFGPCVHGRDPWTRCVEGCDTEEQARGLKPPTAEPVSPGPGVLDVLQLHQRFAALMAAPAAEPATNEHKPARDAAVLAAEPAAPTTRPELCMMCALDGPGDCVLACHARRDAWDAGHDAAQAELAALRAELARMQEAAREGVETIDGMLKCAYAEAGRERHEREYAEISRDAFKADVASYKRRLDTERQAREAAEADAAKQREINGLFVKSSKRWRELVIRLLEREEWISCGAQMDIGTLQLALEQWFDARPELAAMLATERQARGALQAKVNALCEAVDEFDEHDSDSVLDRLFAARDALQPKPKGEP